MSDDAAPRPTPSLADWEALAAKDLKGRPPAELTRTRPEGIEVSHDWATSPFKSFAHVVNRGPAFVVTRRAC